MHKRGNVDPLGAFESGARSATNLPQHNIKNSFLKYPKGRPSQTHCCATNTDSKSQSPNFVLLYYKCRRMQTSKQLSISKKHGRTERLLINFQAIFCNYKTAVITRMAPYRTIKER